MDDAQACWKPHACASIYAQGCVAKLAALLNCTKSFYDSAPVHVSVCHFKFVLEQIFSAAVRCSRNYRSFSFRERNGYVFATGTLIVVVHTISEYCRCICLPIPAKLLHMNCGWGMPDIIYIVTFRRSQVSMWAKSSPLYRMS